MKWILMTFFFFTHLDKANADMSSITDISENVAPVPLIDNDSPFEIMKDLHVFSLRVPPRFIYSAQWLENMDTDSPHLCQIGIKNHRNKQQNVFSHCDENKKIEPADIAATTPTEDL